MSAGRDSGRSGCGGEEGSSGMDAFLSFGVSVDVEASGVDWLTDRERVRFIIDVIPLLACSLAAEYSFLAPS